MKETIDTQTVARAIHASGGRILLSDLTDPQAGGMAHEYSLVADIGDGNAIGFPIVAFQHGPVKEVGVNGAQHADLYRVLLDRLECAQAGPFACAENARQIDHLHAALALDEARTARRIAAQTEGYNRGS